MISLCDMSALSTALFITLLLWLLVILQNQINVWKIIDFFYFKNYIMYRCLVFSKTLREYMGWASFPTGAFTGQHLFLYLKWQNKKFFVLFSAVIPGTKDPKVPGCCCKPLHYYCHKRQLEIVTACPLPLSQTVDFWSVDGCTLPKSTIKHINKYKCHLMCSHLHTSESYFLYLLVFNGAHRGFESELHMCALFVCLYKVHKWIIARY